MKLAIIGSRTCPPINIGDYIVDIPDTIISGGARGADTYARNFAVSHSIKLIEYIPEYDKYPPKIAPLMRDKKIVESCDSVLAFWDGSSRGTRYTIDYAKELGKPVKIVSLV